MRKSLSPIERFTKSQGSFAPTKSTSTLFYNSPQQSQQHLQPQQQQQFQQQKQMHANQLHSNLSYHSLREMNNPNNMSSTSFFVNPASRRDTSPSNTAANGAVYNENIRVAVRVRPPLPRELFSQQYQSVVEVTGSDQIQIIDLTQQPDRSRIDSAAKYAFRFDKVFDSATSQQELYELTAKQSVLSVLEGFNSTVFAYGQTGTGKTYTMDGGEYKSLGDESIGIIPRSLLEVFSFIENCKTSQSNFMVRCSFLQIYNEVITDLLGDEFQALQIREDKRRGVYVEDLSEWAVRSPKDVFALMAKGNNSRATATTKMNETSSRSHAVFMVIVEQVLIDATDQQITQLKTGKLNLVDLAGSERVSVTGATGQRLEESKRINQSLAALGNVIAALTTRKSRSHVPYRDSKITRILEDSLGGNCKTTMIAMVSPSSESYHQTISTLRFAERARSIRNCPVVNSDTDANRVTLLVQYEMELKRLREELDDKRQSIVDKNSVLKLQDQVDQAEQDKEAALQAYNLKLKELDSEKAQKRQLEERIRQIQSQVLVGGKKIEADREYIRRLESDQLAIRTEYEQRIQALEDERRASAEEKIEADEYKDLLLKQRDVMMSLSQRLLERDRRIIQLEEDIEYLEDAETEERNKVGILEAILKLNAIEIPQYKSLLNLDDLSETINGINVTEKNLSSLVDDKYIQNRSVRQVQEIKKRVEEFLNKRKKINDEELKELRDIQTLREQYETKLASLDAKYKDKIQAIHLENDTLQLRLSRLAALSAAKDKRILDLQSAASNVNEILAAIKEKVDIVVEVFSNQKDPNSIKLAARELVQLSVLSSKACRCLIPLNSHTASNEQSQQQQLQYQPQQQQQEFMNNPSPVTHNNIELERSPPLKSNAGQTPQTSMESFYSYASLIPKFPRAEAKKEEGSEFEGLKRSNQIRQQQQQQHENPFKPESQTHKNPNQVYYSPQKQQLNQQVAQSNIYAGNQGIQQQPQHQYQQHVINAQKSPVKQPVQNSSPILPHQQLQQSHYHPYNGIVAGTFSGGATTASPGVKPMNASLPRPKFAPINPITANFA